MCPCTGRRRATGGPLVRARRRARQNGAAPRHGRGFGLPLAVPLAASRFAIGGPLAASRFANGGPLAPRPCGQWRGKCFAIVCVRSRFAWRAPCAPQWHVDACAPGKALRKDARGSAPWLVRSIGFASGWAAREECRWELAGRPRGFHFLVGGPRPPGPPGSRLLGASHKE